jgi:hypothetical protein
MTCKHTCILCPWWWDGEGELTVPRLPEYGPLWSSPYFWKTCITLQQSFKKWFLKLLLNTLVQLHQSNFIMAQNNLRRGWNKMTWKCASGVCPCWQEGKGESTVPWPHWSMGPYGAHHTSEKHASTPNKLKLIFCIYENSFNMKYLLEYGPIWSSP